MLTITSLKVLEFFRQNSGNPKGRYDVYLELSNIFYLYNYSAGSTDRAITILFKYNLLKIVQSSTKGTCRKYQITSKGFRFLKNIKRFVKELEISKYPKRNSLRNKKGI